MTGVRLDGQVAIVTGAARGLGRDYARGLAQAGATVALFDVIDGAPVAAEIGAAQSLFLTVDVSSEAAVVAAVAEVMARFGRIDILVNNAAIASVLQPAPVTDLDVDLWDQVMAVNVRGPFLMAKHVAPHMMAARRGKIINISSGVAYKGARHLLHYVTSKAAVVGLTRGLARDLGPYDICVNTIAPGLIVNDSLAASQPGLDATRVAAAAARSLAREGHPADLVGALLYLCSPASDFLSGQTLLMDGGAHML